MSKPVPEQVPSMERTPPPAPYTNTVQTYHLSSCCKAFVVAAAVAGGTASIVSLVQNFTALGIAKGSAVAAVQSSIGNVAASSYFAKLQSFVALKGLTQAGITAGTLGAGLSASAARTLCRPADYLMGCADDSPIDWNDVGNRGLSVFQQAVKDAQALVDSETVSDAMKETVENSKSRLAYTSEQLREIGVLLEQHTTVLVKKSGEVATKGVEVARKGAEWARDTSRQIQADAPEYIQVARELGDTAIKQTSELASDYASRAWRVTSDGAAAAQGKLKEVVAASGVKVKAPGQAVKVVAPSQPVAVVVKTPENDPVKSATVPAPPRVFIVPREPVVVSSRGSSPWTGIEGESEFLNAVQEVSSLKPRL